MTLFLENNIKKVGTVLFLEDVSLAAGFAAKYFRTAKTAPVVRNLKLHHKQMHYRLSSSFKEYLAKTMTKVITNNLAEHHKLRLYSMKTILGGVNLVGLSL